jgi:hypothetical protein
MYISILSLTAHMALPCLSSSSSFFVSVQCISDPCVQIEQYVDTDINHPLHTLYLLDCKMYKIIGYLSFKCLISVESFMVCFKGKSPCLFLAVHPEWS